MKNQPSLLVVNCFKLEFIFETKIENKMYGRLSHLGIQSDIFFWKEEKTLS